MAERILVVDDEETIREIVCSMLASASYQYQKAGSGNQALAVLKSGEQFELVLTGLMMPDLDGIGLQEAVNAQFPGLPLVFVTAVHDVSVALLCLRQGAYDYLLKPFERSQLLTTIRRALENHRLRTATDADKTTLESLVAARIKELRCKLSKLEFSVQGTRTKVLGLDDDGATDCRNLIVTAFTTAIARTMRLPKEQIAVIERGALLHDVGQVPALRDILLQADRLLPDELAILCRSSHDIYEMLSAIPCLADAAEIVYSYSECFNGSGFPRRLKGEKIPPGARILSAAMTVDDFTHPYRSSGPQSVASARAELQRSSGHRLDPEVVKAILSMPDDIWADLRKDTRSHQ
jgi:response regulator RpfG family c-di-GMP phosphodiesterase